MAISYGIDLTNASNYATGYTGYFVTPLYTLGSNKNLKKFTEIEFQLARPLRTGEGIKVEYRKDLTSSFSTLGTYDYTTWGSVVSHNMVFSIPDKNISACEQLQLRISLTGTTTSPELKSLILR